MATRDERDVLKIIEEEGGETNEVKISNSMGLRLVYTRAILDSMGRRGLIDVLRGGKVRIGDKGFAVLGKSSFGETAYGGNPNETSEDKYQRWMSDDPSGKKAGADKNKKKDKESPYGERLNELSPEERYKKWTESS